MILSFAADVLLLSAANVDAEETINAPGPDYPAAAAAGPGGPFLQQQQSVAARTQHRRRATRIVHHLLNGYSL